MKIETFITTCPREGDSYLSDCLQSCERAGLESVHLFADHKSVIPDGAFTSVHTTEEKRLWAYPNFHRAWQWMMGREWDVLVYVQDDMLLAQNLAWLIDGLLPSWPDDCGVWSPYLAEKSLDEPTLDAFDWWQLPRHRCPRGACCLVFRREDAEAFTKHLPDPRRKAGIEMRVWEAIKKIDKWFYHWGGRSWAQHVGAVSAMHAGAKLNKQRRAQQDWVQDARDVGAVELEKAAEPPEDR